MVATNGQTVGVPCRLQSPVEICGPNHTSSCLTMFFIYQINHVNSHNGFAITMALWTRTW